MPIYCAVAVRSKEDNSVARSKVELVKSKPATASVCSELASSETVTSAAQSARSSEGETGDGVGSTTIERGGKRGLSLRSMGNPRIAVQLRVIATGVLTESGTFATSG
mmetsp:Transcript_5038/g.10833  ORF Transcript_5038/g.10833 Transcript_5038/m.10833 type:complete len:108 (-) Transcript_5038:48-371(-)|eukprot:CAMPEP_0181173232 /NCGR_PEP_ID=MMETSP1096-20121128/2887_1 /TAXON_ID=156174 ORGANISM="Chrysochromulina ericina, Strain CCMP281" /NCGR_SAMPLE_ID=MMETSP1096 /ASSEMBLY_ACC=CAM_ASM_000453 /LENGTH=107 /DNA_ID=CAMNT_0023261041 /DNA_START=520 /DNA_END=843 /DNA_ORIENTATION=-